MDIAVVAAGSIVLGFLLARGYAEVIAMIEQW